MNRKLLALAALSGLLSLMGLYDAALAFVVKRGVLESAEFSAALSGQKPESPSSPEISERESVMSLLGSAEEYSFSGNSSPKYHYIVGQLASRAASLAIADGEKADLVSKYRCAALAHFQKAIELSPGRSLFHLLWARTSADFTDASPCPELFATTATAFNLSSVEPKTLAETRLHWAGLIEPLNAFDLYIASLAQRRLGNKAAALALLNQVERLNPVFTEEQREFFFRLIETREDLQTAITREYPDIIRWVLYFSEKRPKEYHQWEDIFASALIDSLREVESKLDNALITVSDLPQHIKTTDSLPIVSRFDKLRQQLDALLSTFYYLENNKDWAAFLKDRATLTRIPVVKSYLQKDTLPRDTMLSRWRTDQNEDMIVISKINSSVGFFVPEGYSAEIVVLRNAVRQIDPFPGTIEVRTSSDNTDYEIHPPEKPLKAFKVDRKEVLVVPLPTSKVPYVKLRYTNQDTNTVFKNRFFSLVEVYGKKTSTN